jgi:hypothetical protein
MNISRASLLAELESVAAGLAERESLEQSSCFVFDDGKVMTFNGEIYCSRKTTLKGVRGAVKAKPVVDLLNKLTEDDIEVAQNSSELLIERSDKKRASGIRMESEVMLPIESLDDPKDWTPIHPDFTEAVSIVGSCASGDESQFVLTCVHIHPDYLEACDRFQIARYPIKTGVERSILVRSESLSTIVGFGMVDVCETNSWIHFRNQDGLTISIRRFMDDYVSLDSHLEITDFTKISLPGGLEEAVEKAEIFSSNNAVGNNVLVYLKQNRLSIRGEGASGWYMEVSDVSYDGPNLKFLISPKLLVEISKKSNDCGVTEGKLFIDGGKFRYVTCTHKENTKPEKAKE